MARNFCGSFFFQCGLAIFFCFVVRELIFAIRTDWFFPRGINFGHEYLAEVHARETRFFYSHEARKLI